MIERIAAVARADVLIRLRRASTAVIFLLLSASVYLWIPDPASGRAFIEVDGKRAVYNSEAIGVGTALLALIFVSLFGFYVISNAVERDLRSRCGAIIASTPVSNAEYLLGKFAGNLLFLIIFMIGFMVSSMAMLVVRREAPLDVLIFAKQYALLVPPSILFVSAIAILFESIPALSGRFGDVLYFIVWSASFGAMAPMVEKSAGPDIVGWFDFSGFGYFLDQMRHSRITSLSIGASRFDPRKPLFIFSGMHFDSAWLLPRIGNAALSLMLVGVALLFFHRFDPARVRVAARRGAASSGGVSRLRAGSTFLAFGGDSLLAAARTDAAMTFTEPWLILVLLAVAIATLATAQSLPFTLAAGALAICSVSCRDARSGTLALIQAVPRLREQFVAWKFLSALLILGPIMLLPLLRLALTRPSALAGFTMGLLLIGSAATSLGILTRNPRTFVLFLTFWYVVVNDRGRTTGLDFAALYGTPSAVRTAMVAVAAAAFFFLAQIGHAMRLRSDG